MRKAVQFIPVLMLAGCASVSADNCAVSDWSAAGYHDGARGEPFSVIAQRPQQCAQYATAPVYDAYFVGVAKGLSAYCDPANGYATGATGVAYYGVCTGPDGEMFETAYWMGKRMLALRQANVGMQVSLADARAELWKVKQREAIVETALKSPSTLRADRLEYRAELKGLAVERARMEAEIASMANGFANAEDTLADYRSRVPQDTPESGVIRPIQASY